MRPPKVFPIQSLMDSIARGGGMQVHWFMLRDQDGVGSQLWPTGISPYCFVRLSEQSVVQDP